MCGDNTFAIRSQHGAKWYQFGCVIVSVSQCTLYVHARHHVRNRN